jgi:hypothetical protein
MELAAPTPTTWKQRAVAPRTILTILAAMAVGAAAAGVWRQVWLKPRQALTQKRVDATLDLARLYGLQLAYKKAHGTFANDLGALLPLSPEGAALKADLAANADMSTFVVAGDAQRFKIELNVLDPERTSIKIRGPLTPRQTAAPSGLAAPAPPMNADGAPINSGR